MKKIITFLVALLFIAPTFAQFDTLRVKELYVGATGNQSRALRESDTIDFASTVWASSDIARISKLGGGDVIATNPVYGFINNSAIVMSDNRARGAVIIFEQDTVIHGVRFAVTTVAEGATYDNFNGVAIYDASWNLVGQSANDGTIYNSVGTKDVDFTADINITAGKYYVELLYNVSAITTNASISIISGIDVSRPWIGFQLGYYATGVTSVLPTISRTQSNTVPVFVIY